MAERKATTLTGIASLVLFAGPSVGWALRRSGEAVVTERKENTKWSEAGRLMGIIFLSLLLGSMVLLAVLIFRAFTPTAGAEPFYWTEGISSWPVALCWCLSLCLSFMFLTRFARTLWPRLQATAQKFVGPGGAAFVESPAEPNSYFRWLFETAFPRSQGSEPDNGGRMPCRILFGQYIGHAHGWWRVLRIGVIWVVVFLVPWALTQGRDLSLPHVTRGDLTTILFWLNLASGLALTGLLAAVADSVLLCTLFVAALGRRPNEYSSEVLAATRARQSTEGAYGTLLQQPIFRALLLPLGSFSTAQIVQYFVMR